MVVVFYLKIASAYPAPHSLATTTRHVIAAINLLNSCTTLGARCHTCLQSLPNLESEHTAILAVALVPLFATFETHLSLADTPDTVAFTASRLPQRHGAGGVRTPLQVLVPANSHIFPDVLVFLSDSHRTEFLYLGDLELFLAVKPHAGYLHDLAALDRGLEMLSDTVDTKLVLAVECKEVTLLIGVLQITHFAKCSSFTFFAWRGFSRHIIFVEIFDQLLFVFFFFLLDAIFKTFIQVLLGNSAFSFSFLAGLQLLQPVPFSFAFLFAFSFFKNKTIAEFVLFNIFITANFKIFNTLCSDCFIC